MPRSSPATCPSDRELVALLEGRLGEEAIVRLKEHVAGCATCADVVSELGSGRVGATRSPARDGDLHWARHVVTEELASTLGKNMAGSDPAPIGARVGGRFVVEAYAGSGGMGAVYRAHDERTDETVALKLLQRSDDREGAERFAREAKVLSELHHPGIVGYLAHGETEARVPYLAMEWLEGEDLARRLARGPLSIAEALVLLRRVAEALTVAHGRGLVHRDLKPHNLFLRGGEVERVALLDFGIARRGAQSQAITGTGVIIGTLAYMAPEQARGERPLRAAADVFSLGCVLFECISGKPPFFAEQVMAVLAKVLFEEPPRLHHVCPGAPEAVDALLTRMLAKKVEDRLPDAAAILAALDTLAELRPLVGASPSIRGGEQQLLSVLMATPPPSPSSPASPSAATITLAFDERDLRDLAGRGASFEVLADGSLVATILHVGSAVTDHATEAARCAIRIRARWPGARIALATGSGLYHDHALVGEAFDRAAALLRDNSGRPGSDRIMIDEVTRGLLEVRFATERAPSGVYVLTGEELSLDETRPLLGKPTPCVGREAELALLEVSLSASIDEAEPRALLVKAPPGVGKSRLRHEFVRRIAARGDDVTIVIGRGEPLSAGTSYGLFGQAIRRLSGILDGESLDIRREKLARRVGERVPEEAVARVVAFLGEVAAVPFPDEHDARLRAARQEPRLMSDHITGAALEFLRAECAARPVLLVLEDLHWGDALTVKLCGTALRELAGCPLLVLALARPEIDAAFPALWTSTAQVVTLGPLSKKAGERLARQALGPAASLETVGRIVAQSEGNALFLEELIRAAVEGSGEASGTVLAMMQARIGRLPAGARRLLRAASVFGEVTGQGGVHALLQGSMSTQEIDGWLALLLREEILEERSESRFPGERAYRFHHALVRDAAYALSSEEERAAWHLLAAEHLEDRGEPDSRVLAEHFMLGGQPLRAAPHYLRAGEESYEANDLVATLSSAERGLACGAEGELRGALLSLTVSVYMWQDAFAEVVALGKEAIDLLRPGTKPWCRSVGCVSVGTTVTGHEALLAELASRTAAVEPSPDARSEYVRGATWFAIMLGIVGRKDESRTFRERARQVGAAIEGEDLLAIGYLEVAEGTDHYLIEELPWSALTRHTAGSEALRAVGEERYQVTVRAHRGLDLHDLGDLAGAEAELREITLRAERLDEAVPLTYARAFLARLLARTAPVDRLDEPERLARAVIAAKNASITAIAHGALAEIRRRQGDLAGAEREARAAREAALPFPSYAPEVTALHASILLAQGRPEEALAVAEAGVQELERLGLEGAGEIDLRLSLAEALHAAGRASPARAALAGTMPRLKKRLDDIPDRAVRARYLANVPANARLVALARGWLGDEAVRDLDASP